MHIKGAVFLGTHVCVQVPRQQNLPVRLLMLADLLVQILKHLLRCLWVLGHVHIRNGQGHRGRLHRQPHDVGGWCVNPQGVAEGTPPVRCHAKASSTP
jgi:hypothetical protein